MRVCTGCSATKPVAEFWAWQRCKECRRAYKRGLAVRQRATGATAARARARYHNSATGERARVARHLERWRARNPEKIAAQHAVETALNAGRLHRQPCETCGGNAQAHHGDYTRPLEVRWLCPLHHARQHVAEGRLDHLRVPA